MRTRTLTPTPSPPTHTGHAQDLGGLTAEAFSSFFERLIEGYEIHGAPAFARADKQEACSTLVDNQVPKSGHVKG